MIKNLIKILRILSDTSINQTVYLLELGTYPSTDEFALEFSHLFEVISGNQGEGTDYPYLDEKVMMNLDKIDKIFEEMSEISNNSFWNVSSLNSKDWKSIRHYAGEALHFIQ